MVLSKIGPLNLHMFAWAIHRFKVETWGYMINILKAFHTVLERNKSKFNWDIDLKNACFRTKSNLEQLLA